MTAEHTDVGKGLLLRWVLANAIGLGVGIAIWGIMQDTVGGHAPRPSVLFEVVAIFLTGAVVGTAQWLVLRDQVNYMGWGILAISAGWVAGMGGGYAIAGPPLDFAGGFLALGLVGGIVQWLGLRSRIDRAGWLVPASVLGLIIGGVVAIGLAMVVGDALDAAFGSGVTGFAAVLTMLGVVGGAVGGAINGAVLLRLLRQPAATSAQPSPPEV